VCIGAALTLMEAESVFRQLMQRWPRLELAEQVPRWNGNPVYRGLTKLQVQQAAGVAA
jgi:cytochrome P450